MAGPRLAVGGWQGSSGPGPTLYLWKQLLHELDCKDRTIEWVKFPSHVQVSGNE